MKLEIDKIRLPNSSPQQEISFEALEKKCHIFLNPQNRREGKTGGETAKQLTWPVPQAGLFMAFLFPAVGLLRSLSLLNPGEEIWFGEGRVCGGRDSIKVRVVVDLQALV